MDNTIKQAKLHGKTRPYGKSSTGLKDLPWLNLTGVWLERAGFPIGQPIEIEVEKDKLIIKAVK